MTEAKIRAAFAGQGDWCERSGAPFMARVCRLLAERLDQRTEAGARILDWAGDPVADALMMRVTGGLNALRRSGAAPELDPCYPPHEVDDATLGDALAQVLGNPDLLPWLDGAPQTNEVGRSAVLMAGLLVVAAGTGLPIAIHELGASAGLNLRLDDYRYTLGGLELGRSDAPLHLAPAWKGPPPPAAMVEIFSRRGVDLSPIDVGDGASRERLLAYVWPEQAERIARLEAALAAAAADPPAIDRADAAGWVEANVGPVEGVATVVLHSIAFQYFPAATQDRIAAHLAAVSALATPAAPLAWLRYEMDIAAPNAPPTLRLRSWPDGEDRLLARAHPHGASIEWLS